MHIKFLQQIEFQQIKRLYIYMYVHYCDKVKSDADGTSLWLALGFLTQHWVTDCLALMFSYVNVDVA